MFFIIKLTGGPSHGYLNEKANYLSIVRQFSVIFLINKIHYVWSNVISNNLRQKYRISGLHRTVDGFQFTRLFKVFQTLLFEYFLVELFFMSKLTTPFLTVLSEWHIILNERFKVLPVRRHVLNSLLAQTQVTSWVSLQLIRQSSEQAVSMLYTM